MSVAVTVVVENCEALTKPIFVGNWAVLRTPVMKHLSRPAHEAVSKTKLYQGIPENNWPFVGAVNGFAPFATEKMRLSTLMLRKFAFRPVFTSGVQSAPARQALKMSWPRALLRCNVLDMKSTS